jgi:hypothetical protein
VSLNTPAISLTVGNTETRTATVQPTNADNKNISWSSNNTNVARVNNGLVTAVAAGTATITVTTQDGNKTASCSVAVTGTPLTGRDIYVAGMRRGSGRYIATLWKNGQAQSLTNGTYDAVAESIYVTDTDTYAAGYEQSISGSFVAKVWRNGQAQNLTNGTYDAAAYSIAVSNGNVYVAGVEFDAQDRAVATLWVNGTPQRLGDGTYPTYAYNVQVSGSDVYVCGEYRNGSRQVAALWKNRQLQVLGNDVTNTVASSVAVANGNVYVVGAEVDFNNIRTVLLWTNGASRRISDGDTRADAHSIAVSGNDVYISGGYQKYYPVSGYNFAAVWKNGTRQDLEPGLSLTIGSYARSIFVIGNSVYAAGVQRSMTDVDYAFVWVNGVPENLASNAEARGVFVK